MTSKQGYPKKTVTVMIKSEGLDLSENRSTFVDAVNGFVSEGRSLEFTFREGCVSV